MKKNRGFLRVVALLGICAALTITAFAAGVGMDKDPLVTLSYLNETFMDSVMNRVDQKIEDRNQKLASQGVGGQSDTFAVVTLTNGQTLKGAIGCEVMLRVGTAVCVSPSAPGLIDETTGGVLNNSGALVQNHLYMMTIDGRGVKATAGTVKLMVRGGYTIG